MRGWTKGLAAVAGLALAGAAMADQAPGEKGFRDLYKELVETNTTASVGDCTKAAHQLEARLKAGGYKDADIHFFVPSPEQPKAGGIVVKLEGTDAQAKPVLLLAHLDVVEAKREDWSRDPFTLVEEGGYFYGRGTSDDKAQAAIWADSMIRFKQEGYKPKHTIKMALTCGEETGGSGRNGAMFLAEHHKDWIDAGVALNEGRGGALDANGKKVLLTVEAGEKNYQDFQLEVTNPGGHSSQPLPDNAIYRLSEALVRLSKTDTPVVFNDVTRAYFTKMADIETGETAAAMRAILKDPTDKAANATLSKDRGYHAQLRTTCVATMGEAGHAPNALPQRARANINCRILPGTPTETIRQYLVDAVADPQVAVTAVPPFGGDIHMPVLTPDVMGPLTKLAGEMFPGVPVVPTMANWGTDGRFLNDIGIPTFGIDALFRDPDFSNVHGLNERVRVQSLFEDREFLFKLAKAYAGA